MSNTKAEWKKVFESDLDYVARELRDIVEKPALVILSGPVGAGKTAFTKVFVGENENVMSPTYSIVNEVGSAAHADFYRIEKDEEVTHLELELYADDKEYFLVEWGKPYYNAIMRELGKDFVPYEMEISIQDNGSRNFTLHQL